MPVLTVTKHWASGAILFEADLDFIKDDLETFFNTTKIDDDNIQNAGITASSKLIDASISTIKLAEQAVETAKINNDAITTVKIADASLESNVFAEDARQLAVPTGTMWSYAGSSAPTGWLLCEGSAISRTTYSALFTVISTLYGVGNGSTTFNIPDCRGRALAYLDATGARLTAFSMTPGGNTLGATGGTQTHLLTAAQLPRHAHSVSDTVSTGAASTAGAASLPSGSVALSSHTHSLSTTSSNAPGGSGGTAHLNMQPSVIMNVIIRT